MTARFSTAMMNDSHCATSAAAAESVRIRPLMDTAVLLVVSICVLCLLPIII